MIFAGNCPKSDRTIDQRRCVLRPCPEWTSWSDWTDCLTCERKEIRYRKRHCRIGLIRVGDNEPECPGMITIVFRHFYSFFRLFSAEVKRDKCVNEYVIYLAKEYKNLCFKL